jgi:hypothetical protein
MRLKLMSGDTIEITEQEALNIQGKSGLVFVPSVRGLINLSSVESVLPAGVLKNINEGYLHDGTKVVKKFGIWVDAFNPDCKLDVGHYPEIGKDDVLSENPKDEIRTDRGLDVSERRILSDKYLE